MSRRALHVQERNAAFDSSTRQPDYCIQRSPSNDSQSTLKSLQLADVFDFRASENWSNPTTGRYSQTHPDLCPSYDSVSGGTTHLAIHRSQTHAPLQPPLYYVEDEGHDDFEYHDRGPYRRSGHVWPHSQDFCDANASFRLGVSVISEGDECGSAPCAVDPRDEVVFLQDGDEILEYGSPHDDILFVEREDDDPFDEVIFLESDDNAARLVRAAADESNETSFFWELIRFQKSRCWKKKAMTALVTLTSLYIFIDLVFLGNVQKGINVLLRWMDNNPVGASFSFIGTFIVTALLFIPTAPLIFAAGYCFSNVIGFWSGFAVATVVSIVGLGTGAMLSFLRARFMAQDLVQLFAQRYPIVKAADCALHRKGFKIMFLLRLCPLIPFNGLNYIGGVTSVSVRDFALSLVGLLPTNVLWVLVGAGTDKLANRSVQDSGLQIYMGVLFGVSLWFAVFGLFLVWKTAMKELRKEIELNSAENWYRYKSKDPSDAEGGGSGDGTDPTQPGSDDAEVRDEERKGDAGAPQRPDACPLDFEISFLADGSSRPLQPRGVPLEGLEPPPPAAAAAAPQWHGDFGGVDDEKSYDCEDDGESVIFMADGEDREHRQGLSHPGGRLSRGESA